MLKHIVAGSSCLSLAACGTFQAQSRVDPIKIATYASANNACIEPVLPYDRHFGAYNLDCFKFKGDGQLAYIRASTSRGYRNRLAAFLINESNTVCTREMGDLVADEAMVNAGLASATTAFSTIGSIVTGRFAANALAGAASGTNAIRGHVNAEVYRNVLGAAVSKAIRQAREAQFDIIYANRAKGIDDYSVDDMLLQVNQYHQICSFYRGLDLVITAVDRNAYHSNDPRGAAAVAIEMVRADIADIDRQLAKSGITDDEKAELIEQRKALRTHETELMKQFASVPTPIPAQPAPTTTPTADPAPAQPETKKQTGVKTKAAVKSSRTTSKKPATKR